MKKFENQNEFDTLYMIVLEGVTNVIKQHTGLYVSDHALLRLCEGLEKEMAKGEDIYE